MRRFSAADKCRAVLSLWTERRSLSQLCQELGVTWNLLTQWQEQAMEGMLQALAPKRAVPCSQVPLNTRLQSLLERKSSRPAPSEPSEPKTDPRPGPAKRPLPPPRTVEISPPGLIETTPQKPPKTA
jgi:transposase-like protein